MNEILRKKQGITLIALVITIIVLLILAGVTMATLIGDNGLLIKTNDVKKETNEETIKERISLAVQASIIESQETVEKEKLENELKNEFGEENFTLLAVGEGYLVIVDNVQYKIDKNGTVGEGKKIVESIIEFPGDLSKGGQYDGTTEETAYQINCIEDLVEWSKNYKKYQSSYIILERTLDFETIDSYNDYTAITTDINGNAQTEPLIQELTTGTGFKPIATYFKSFDGKNHEINNIYENITGDAGLFARGQGAIQNLKISGKIKTTGNYAAGFIGWPNGGVTIVNCVNSCDIECNGAAAGGLIGITSYKTSIYNSINLGNILATQYVGGIIGANLRAEVNIINSANLGDIGAETKGEYVGGIIGYYISYYKGQEPFNIINTYNSGKIEGIKQKAGIIGGNYNSQGVYNIENNFYLEESATKGIYNFPDNAETKTKEYMQSQEFVDELNKYVDENPTDDIVLSRWKYKNNDYPTFE